MLFILRQGKGIHPAILSFRHPPHNQVLSPCCSVLWGTEVRGGCQHAGNCRVQMHPICTPAGQCRLLRCQCTEKMRFLCIFHPFKSEEESKDEYPNQSNTKDARYLPFQDTISYIFLSVALSARCNFPLQVVNATSLAKRRNFVLPIWLSKPQKSVAGEKLLFDFPGGIYAIKLELP